MHEAYISADNPFADLIAKSEPTSAEPATNDLPASGGLAIAPKGGAPVSMTEAPSQQWADVAGQAGENLLPSAGTDIWDAVTDPRQTARSLKNVVFGTAEKLVPGEQSHKKYANAVGQFFSKRRSPKTK
jgi:hypothetical protein